MDQFHDRIWVLSTEKLNFVHAITGLFLEILLNSPINLQARLSSEVERFESALPLLRPTTVRFGHIRGWGIKNLFLARHVSCVRFVMTTESLSLHAQYVSFGSRRRAVPLCVLTPC